MLDNVAAHVEAHRDMQHLQTIIWGTREGSQSPWVKELRMQTSIVLVNLTQQGQRKNAGLYEVMST